jgi:hypothetical protein
LPWSPYAIGCVTSLAWSPCKTANMFSVDMCIPLVP